MFISLAIAAGRERSPIGHACTCGDVDTGTGPGIPVTSTQTREQEIIFSIENELTAQAAFGDIYHLPLLNTFTDQSLTVEFAKAISRLMAGNGIASGAANNEGRSLYNHNLNRSVFSRRKVLHRCGALRFAVEPRMSPPFTHQQKSTAAFKACLVVRRVACL